MNTTDQTFPRHSGRGWAAALLVGLMLFGAVGGSSQAWAAGVEGNSSPEELINYHTVLQPSVGSTPLPPELVGTTTIFSWSPTMVGKVVTIRWACPGYSQMVSGTMQKHFMGIPAASGVAFRYPLAWGLAGPPIGCHLEETLPASMPGPLGAYLNHDVPNPSRTMVFVDHGYL